MQKFKKNFLMTLTSLATVGLVSYGLPAMAEPWKPSTPALPVSNIADLQVMSSVVISPDGKHVAAVTLGSNRQNVVTVWSTDDMTKAPVTIGASSMSIYSVQFLKNDRIMITGLTPVTMGANSEWYAKYTITDLEGKKFIEPFGSQGEISNKAGLVSRLGNDKENVLFQVFNEKSYTVDLVKYNIYKGTQERLARGGDYEEYGRVDSKGELRTKSELKPEGGSWINHIYWKNPSGDWIEQLPLKDDIHERHTISIIKLNYDASKAWVITNQEANYAEIKLYDFATQKYEKTLFKNTEFDASGVVFWQPSEDANEDDPVLGDIVAGYCYDEAAEVCVYSDPTLKGLQAKLEKLFPNTNVSIVARKGGKATLVKVSAPQYPTTWFLLKDGKNLIKIGSVLKDFDMKNLGTAQWVDIPARDGNKIPSVVYLPPGYDKTKDGTIPLVVMPHGGPWARDYWDWDFSNWAQMFATRGFAVIQPNYRGSEGLGLQHWKNGDKQWGLGMQDDVDDSAKWLVAQGVADPNRMMVYGYSYGGFSASAAAARSGGASKGLWQCAISGAPVIDIDKLRTNEWGEGRIQRKVQGWTVDGWNPQKHLDEVEIPWLIYHGEYDRQADTMYSHDATAKMKALNKPNFKYVEIPRMSHPLVKQYPVQREYYLNLMLDWMANDCGNISKYFDAPDSSSAVKKKPPSGQ